jgi:hypothetical protein
MLALAACMHSHVADDDRRDALPGLAVVGLPMDEDAAMSVLAGTEQFEVMPDRTFQADLDVPEGTWRLWADRGVAVWIGARPGEIPRVRSNANLDLFELAIALSDAGLMLRDLKVREGGVWHRRMRAPQALRFLAEHPSAEAMRGVWSDKAGRVVRVELHSSGIMFAHDSVAVGRLADAVGRTWRG